MFRTTDNRDSPGRQLCAAAALLLALAVVQYGGAAWAGQNHSHAVSAKQLPTDPPIDRFEDDIRQFEKEVAADPNLAPPEKRDPSNPNWVPPEKRTVFVGSSTFTRWATLEVEFKDVHAINRGFGGSTIPEITYYADRVILPLRPGRVVLYAGTNDIGEERHTGEQVFQAFLAFAQKIHAELPSTEVYFVSSSVAPSRLKYKARYDVANHLIRAYAAAHPELHLHFIDVTGVMTENNRLCKAYFGPDNLHMTEAGYAAWHPIIEEALHNDELRIHQANCPHPPGSGQTHK